MTVKQKLYLALGSLSLIILLLGSLSVKMMSNLNHQGNILATLNTSDLELYQARLSQADYMITEQPGFVESVNRLSESSKLRLEEAQAQMEVISSIEEIDVIKSSITDFEVGFKHFIVAKDISMQGREKFEITARSVSTNIDAILASISEYFTNNQQDFEEFSRYKEAQYFKDTFDHLQVLIWRYNTKPSEDIDKEILASITNLKSTQTKLSRIMLAPSTQGLLRDLNGNFSQYEALYIEVKESAGELVDAAAEMMKGASKASNLTAKLISEERDIASAVRSSVTTYTLLAVFGAIILSIILATWLIRTIMTPLNQSIKFATTISEGDLTQSIKVNGSDEFSALNNALNDSVTAIRNVISKIQGTTQVLDSSNSNISEAISNSNETIRRQQLETDSLATAINEMSSATLEIARNASAASSSSGEAEQQAVSSNHVIGQTRGAMGELSLDMNAASTDVTSLNDEVGNISSILSVIRGIADQTNLLALNAAIEAARAGEQGRGFSVVADEVRTLAQKTQASIEEITSIIDGVQNGAERVVSTIGKSEEKTISVAGLTEQSSEAFDKILDAIKSIAGMNAQVSVAAEEQTSVTEEINNNITKIKDVSDENVAVFSEILKKIALQVSETKNLAEQVKFFKT